MNHDIVRYLLHIGVTVLVPIIMAGLARLFPFKSVFSAGTEEFEVLQKRNNWIDVIAGIFCLAGIWSGAVLYLTVLEKSDPIGLGFAFGLSVIAPVVWISAITLPSGRWRFDEFWYYYELKYKIGRKGLVIIFTPFALVGIVSTGVMVFRLLTKA